MIASLTFKSIALHFPFPAYAPSDGGAGGAPAGGADSGAGGGGCDCANTGFEAQGVEGLSMELGADGSMDVSADAMDSLSVGQCAGDGGDGGESGADAGGLMDAFMDIFGGAGDAGSGDGGSGSGDADAGGCWQATVGGTADFISNAAGIVGDNPISNAAGMVATVVGKDCK